MIKNIERKLRTELKKTNSSVAYCALSIKSGTRNEGLEYSGLAHMTEHMLFKGTQQHSVSYINSRIERLGGELNAYTTKEETVIYSTVLKEDIAKALDLILEIAFCSSFDEHELEKEKNVVLDEINSYKDSPSEQIYDDFEELLFDGCPLSYPVLGTKKTVKKITSQVMKDYVLKFFTPENMVLSVAADVQQKDLDKILEKLMDKYIAFMPKENGINFSRNFADSFSVSRVFDEIPKKKNHQAHCVIGTTAYSYNDTRRIPLILLVNILGGPASNSSLNILLREKNALVYTVDASYNQYSDTGCVTIYFGSDKTNADKCMKLIYDELEKIRNKPFSENKLKEAKKQLMGQLLISSDNGEAQALSMGKSVLAFGEVIPMEKVRELVEAITVEDLLECAQDIFAPEKLSKLLYM